MKSIRVLAAIVMCIKLLSAADLTSSSGDGIPDVWKTGGVAVTYPDGTTARVDLKSMGAAVGQKDVFVFIAWMDANDHSHKPNPASLERIRQSFLAAPVSSPNGSVGINLHFV